MASMTRCLVNLLIALHLSVLSTRVAVLGRRGLTPTVEPCGGNVGGSRNVSVARTLLQIDKLGYPPAREGCSVRVQKGGLLDATTCRW